MKLIVLSFLLLIASAEATSQTIVNAFAEVTAVTGASVLSLGAVNETWHSFEDGDLVLIFQMQDNVVTTSTTNAASFGTIDNIASAGRFEVAAVLSHTEAAGVPSGVTLANPLVNTYNFGPNAAVQLVTFRDLGAFYTTTAAIGTTAWNGTLGGIVAVSVSSVLTLLHPVTANGKGFRGGAMSAPSAMGGCDPGNYIAAYGPLYAAKGEGIYKYSNAGFAGGRGRIANGGGGGNANNAGGGGGGHYFTGGNSGPGWNGNQWGCNPGAFGMGGASLSTFVNGARIFMGGGGGGGQQNNASLGWGGVGGGIVIIKASTLTTTSCTGLNVSANGATAADVTADGAGGGGAGGTVFFQVTTFSVAPTCTLLATANGGNGGNSFLASNAAVAGGGGGAQGVVMYSGPIPTVNVNSTTLPGYGGISCNFCGAVVNGVAGTGPSNAGIIGLAAGPLPVELLQFYGRLNNQQQVELSWATGVEKSFAGFEVQRLDANGNLSRLGYVAARGSYNSYSFTDTSPAGGTNYYRLKKVETNGDVHFSSWITLQAESSVDFTTLYPNPLAEGQHLWLNTRQDKTVCVQMTDPSGRTVFNDSALPDANGFIELPSAQLRAGLYILRVNIGRTVQYHKLLVID